VERSLSSAVGGVVGIAIAKELAPVMMAILIAAASARRCGGNRLDARVSGN